MEALHANWNYPTQMLVGPGRIEDLPELCFETGMRKPLLITDPGLATLPMTQKIIAMCQSSGVGLEVFSDIKSNPNGENIEHGVAAYQEGGHDGVIALGGGSALDAAKAIALMVGQNQPLWDFEDEGDNWLRVQEDRVAHVIAIPTTAGTGSEVGRASVITHTEQQRKVIIFHPKMLPSHVILDPLLTLGLPRSLTAATGMDALSHCLEAYCAQYYHPMAEGIAIEAMRLIKQFLPIVCEDGSDINARQQMLVASSMGATAFQRGLGGMHAIAHSLGALYDAHHGMLNAILMPYVLVANQAKIEVRITRLARYLELDDCSFEGFLSWVLTLRKRLDIPHDLRSIGIDDKQSVRVGQMSQQDPSSVGNPVEWSALQYQGIFEAALAGSFEGLGSLGKLKTLDKADSKDRPDTQA